MKLSTVTLVDLLMGVLPGAADLQASIYVPPGLSPGDTYHLVFVTEGYTNATSSDIDYYNAFVQSEAARNPSLTGTEMGVTWRVIASTSAIDARDNAHVEAPVYLLNGTKVADDHADFWDGFLDAPVIVDQFVDTWPAESGPERASMVAGQLGTP